MNTSIKLHVWGEHACFTRPEMKVERVSYDVITPSAARGVLEAVHWKPEIRWIVTRLHVLKPIRFQTIRRNEIKSKGPSRIHSSTPCIVVEDDRTQRSALVLRDVAYIIEAKFMLAGDATNNGTAAKHLDMFNRRVAKGQCFHRPYLGVREFPANFAPVESKIPEAYIADDTRDRDLGWMLHDIDYTSGMTPRYFQAKLINGIVDVPSFHSTAVKA